MKNKFTTKDNIIDSWLHENGDTEITKQVEIEAEELMKNKETLEEAAERFYPFKTTDLICSPKLVRDGFISGAKWQAERMYSDEALQMESKKQQQYDEMLAMLEKHLIFHNGEMEGLEQPSSEMWFELYEKTEQLIKEAKEL